MARIVLYAALLATLALLFVRALDLPPNTSSPGHGERSPHRVRPLNELPERPDPSLDPTEVVRIQLEALRGNDESDAGIARCFEFASPENQAMTGPLGRFIEMIRNGPYRVMLDYRAVRYGVPRVAEDQAQQPVLLIPRRGRPIFFVFQLMRQSGGRRDGCWLTGGVFTLPLNHDESSGDRTSVEI